MGVNLTELIVIFLVALLLFGPEQLPNVARQLAKVMGELRKGSNALRREFYNSAYPPVDLKRDLASAGRTLRALKTEGIAGAMLTSLEAEATRRGSSSPPSPTPAPISSLGPETRSTPDIAPPPPPSEPNPV